MTLAYIDFLFKDDPEYIYRPLLIPGQPRLPLHIRLAGLGTYFSPWYVDTNDKLIQAVPQYSLLEVFIYAAWLDFIADLNKNLRNITRTELRRGLPMLTQYLGDVWTMKRLGGLIVEFCVFVNAEYRNKAASPRERYVSFDDDTDNKSNKSTERDTNVSNLSSLQKALLTDDEEASPRVDRSSLTGDIVHEDLRSWRVNRTPRTFRALCDGLGTGELLPGIVVYHPSVVGTDGSWLSSEFKSPHASAGEIARSDSPPQSKIMESLKPYDPPDVDQATANATEQIVVPQPSTPNPLLYGSKAADLEKFYKIVSVADKRDSARIHNGLSNFGGNSPLSASPPNTPFRDRDIGLGSAITTSGNQVKSMSISKGTPSVSVPVSPARSNEVNDEEYMSFPMAHTFERRKWLFPATDPALSTSPEQNLNSNNLFPLPDINVGSSRPRNRVDSAPEIDPSDLIPPVPAEATEFKPAPKTPPHTESTAPTAPRNTDESSVTIATMTTVTKNEEADFEVTPHSMWRWDKFARRMINVFEATKKEEVIERHSSVSSTHSIMAKAGILSSDSSVRNAKISMDPFIDQVKEFLLDLLLFTLTILNRFLLGRNARPRGPAVLRQIIATVLQLCCLFDFVALSFLAVTYWCIWDDESLCNSQMGFYIVMGVWPGALVVTPILGFASITLGSIGTLPRVYSVWSRLAIISYLNLVWIYLTRRNNAPNYTILVLMGMGISRFLQCSFVDLYIAHLESLRRTRGWDGLPTSLVIARDNDDTVI
jgi:hypothetical protein